MAEPPYKRSRRDDDYDRPRFESRNPRDRFRSRSPDRRDRGGRYDRDRDVARGDRRRGDDRHARPDYRGEDRRRDQHAGVRGERDYYHDKRDRRGGKDEDPKARSRSPRLSPKPRRDRSRERGAATAAPARPGFERAPGQSIPMRDRRRTSTPPVTFKVGRPDSRGASKDRDARSPSRPQEASAHNRPKAADFIGKDDMDMDGEEGDADDLVVEEDDAMAAMQAMMGFGGFDTTKQKKIPGNDVGAVRKEKKTNYRQYMNRQGGFNRPLSPSRD